MKHTIHRRTVLKTVGTASAAGMLGLAGCTLQESNGNGGGTDGGGDGGKPDVLVAIGYPESGIQLFNDYYKEYGTDTPILGSDGLNSAKMMKVGDQIQKNVKGTAPAAGGTAREFFTKAYTDMHGGEPGVFNTQSFDATVVLLLANLAAGKNDSAAIKKNLRAIANGGGKKLGPKQIGEAATLAAAGKNIDYTGTSSSVNFDDNGDIVDATYMVYSFGKDGIKQEDTVDGSSDKKPVKPGAPSGGGSKSGRTVKLGMLMAESGDLGSVGTPIRKAAEVAVKQFKDNTDFEYDVQIADTQTDPAAGISAAKNLVNAGYPAVVGPLSSGVNLKVTNQVLIPNSVVGCSPSSTSPAVTDLKDDDYIFRTAPADNIQGPVMAKVATNNLNAKTASIIYVNNSYGQKLSQFFTDAFEGTVKQSVAFEKGQNSYSSKLQKAMEG